MPRPLDQDQPADPVEESAIAQAYYLLQYERIAYHENGRLQFTNFVVAASVIALGVITASADDRVLLPLVVALTVVAANIVAIFYTVNSRRWVKVHQRRAAAALNALSPDLKKLQQEADRRTAEDIPALKKRLAPSPADESKQNSSWLRSQTLLSWIHVCLVLAALACLVGATTG
jgi:hypothetical protein